MKGKLSDWLPHAMEQWGMDAKVVAHKSGLSRGSIYHLSNGTRGPSLKTCNSLAPVFGMHPVDLLIALGLVPPLPESFTPRLLDETERAIMNAVVRLDHRTKQMALRFVLALAEDEETGNGAAGK